MVGIQFSYWGALFSGAMLVYWRVGGNSNNFLFSPLLHAEDEPILTCAYFSNGLGKKPPTGNMNSCIFLSLKPGMTIRQKLRLLTPKDLCFWKQHSGLKKSKQLWRNAAPGGTSGASFLVSFPGFFSRENLAG